MLEIAASPIVDFNLAITKMLLLSAVHAADLAA